MSEWKDLWLSNYKGQGDTAELEKHLKTLGYGNRMNVTYLPWAVVERIFKLQGGSVEWLPVSDGTYVDLDYLVVGKEYDHEGVEKELTIQSYFINVRAKWQGQEYTERYPLQDSNGKALTRWTQNELNKSYQRGKVKAIAIVSGIGYKLFEDGDLQFEDVEPSTPPKVKVVETKKPKEKPAEPEKLTIDPEGQDLPEDRNKKEQDIKREFLSGEEKAKTIKQFLVEKSVSKINDLNEEDLDDLWIRVVY